MTGFTDTLFDEIVAELSLIWKAHIAVGLNGKMCLYTQMNQDPWRAKNATLRIWFGEEENEIQDAVKQVRQHYEEGRLPNSPLLLNPMVHQIDEFGRYEPIGSGIVWCSSLALGVAGMDEQAVERLEKLGLYCGWFERGSNRKAGLKVVGFSNKILPPLKGVDAVEGNEAIYQLANTESVEYRSFYLLSGLEYLSKNGSFYQPSFHEILHQDLQTIDLAACQIDVTSINNAATSWKAYEKHHSLYVKFGTNPEDIAHNMRYFNLVGRDIELFDATGTDRNDKDETFEFLVEGWVPIASTTVMGATGGTGKSSMAHRLAIASSIDWKENEQPLWLGSKINKEKAQGLVIYFSGEDSAAIVNARAQLIDPEGRSTRLMLQRTNFGEDEDGKRQSIGQFLRRLRKLPDVSLVVIDPARKYLEGDEEDSEIVSNFFEAIEEFTIEKKCGMLVVHHLIKNAHPADTRDIYDMLRGSQVFIDRPRAVIGMMRDGPYTVVGLSKNNIPPNLGSVRGERVFVRDPDRLDLMWLPGPEGVRSFEVSNDELRELRERALTRKED